MLKLDKVLHVEDDMRIRRLVREYFQPEWTRIEEAGTVEDGLRLVEATGNNYQLILLDLSLPWSRSDPRTDPARNIETFRKCSIAPIVVHTGLDSDFVEALEREPGKCGVYGVIRKGTFTIPKVRAFIENAVRSWREEKFTKSVGSMTKEIDGIAEYRRRVLGIHGGA